MDEYIDLDCAIYFDAPVTLKQLEALVSDIPEVKKGQDATLNPPHVEVYVHRNSDANANLRTDQENGFLFYPYRVDVEGTLEQSIEEQIALVSAILELLWRQQFNAVAACDFEDRLPRSGHDAWGAS